MPKATVIEHKNGDKEVERTITKSITEKPQLLMMGEIKPGDTVRLIDHVKRNKNGEKTWTVILKGK